LNKHIFSTFKVKKIINVFFLFYDFVGKIREWKLFKQ